jgi:hypothetical protein
MQDVTIIINIIMCMDNYLIIVHACIHVGGGVIVSPAIQGIIIASTHACSDTDQLQVPVLWLVSTAAVFLDVARENHQTATVIACAMSLKIAALMQTHCVR